MPRSTSMKTMASTRIGKNAGPAEAAGDGQHEGQHGDGEQPVERTSARRPRTRCSTSGQASRKSLGLKNWSRTLGQLGLLTTSHHGDREEHDGADGGDERARAPSSRPPAPALAPRRADAGARALVGRAAGSRSVTAVSSPGSGCRHPGSATPPRSVGERAVVAAAWPAPRSRRPPAGCRPRRGSRAPRPRPPGAARRRSTSPSISTAVM